MGNCSTFCRPRWGFCSRFKHANILKVVRRDGKPLQFNGPVLVKEILVKSPGAVIGVTEEAKEQFPPDYDRKVGKADRVLPCSSSAPPARAFKRIKVVITKQQLQQLLAKQVSTEQVLAGLNKRNFDYPTSWKPELECIPEGSD